MLTATARAYSAVFTPELFVLCCGLLLVGYEWRGSATSPAGLGARVGVLGAGWVVAFAVYEGVPRIAGQLPEWAPDATGSAGLGIGIGLIWLVWRLREWGPFVPGFALVLVAVTVPHLLLTPFWDISTHVLYAVTPAGYLTALDRRFAPLVAVGVGMVFARPLAGAHTWPQSVAGFALAVAVLLAVRSRDRDPLRA